jgi:hypothetical protein
MGNYRSSLQYGTLWTHLFVVSLLYIEISCYEVDFARFSGQPLTILGVTGPFSVLAENMYELSEKHFHVSPGALYQQMAFSY